MKSRKWLAAVACAGLALGAAACGGGDGQGTAATGGGSGGGTVNGAGSTFAAPIYQQLGSTLKDQGVTVNYQPVGSGAGIAQLTAGTVAFAGSDPPMKDDELAAARKKGDPVHIPVAFGAITVAYNVPGVGAGLKLDGPTIADIFLGKVTRWDDPEIAKANPGVKLPSSDIAVVHRSDESGTTKGFTDFLQQESPEWKSKVGSDKTVKWPTGTGAKGNDGVAAAVKQTEGSIGYVEQAYALQNHFTTAAVKNSSGRYVPPSLESTTAAGEGVKVPGDLRFTIVNSPNPKAYPIASQTFLIVYRDDCKAGVLKKGDAPALARFLDYVTGDGQQVLEQLAYAKLPDSLLAKAKEKVQGLQCDGGPLAG